MHLVDAVLELVEEAPVAPALLGLDECAWFVIGVEPRKFRRLTGPEIDENEAQVLARRIARDFHPVVGRALFRRAIDTLALAVVLPAVVVAAHAVAFDPARRQPQPAMRAKGRDQMRRPALTAEDRELFAHDLERLGLARGQVRRQEYRLPEPLKSWPANPSGPTRMASGPSSSVLSISIAVICHLRKWKRAKRGAVSLH